MFFWRKSYSGTCMLSGRCGGSCGWLSRFNFECTAKIWMSRWMWSWYAWATMAAWILLGIHPYQSKVSVMPFQFRWLEVFGHCTSSLNFCVRIVFSQIFVVSLRSDFCVWNPSTSIDCGIGIARWTKPPLIHEAAGIIRPCSLLRLLVFDLGRLVGAHGGRSARGQNGYGAQWSWRLKPFGSDQMANRAAKDPLKRVVKRETRAGGEPTAFTLGVWKVTLYPATNSSQPQRKVLVFPTFSECWLSFGKIQELDLLRHVPIVNLRWVLSSHMTKSRECSNQGPAGLSFTEPYLLYTWAVIKTPVGSRELQRIGPSVFDTIAPNSQTNWGVTFLYPANAY